MYILPLSLRLLKLMITLHVTFVFIDRDRGLCSERRLARKADAKKELKFFQFATCGTFMRLFLKAGADHLFDIGG